LEAAQNITVSDGSVLLLTVDIVMFGVAYVRRRFRSYMEEELLEQVLSVVIVDLRQRATVAFQNRYDSPVDKEAMVGSVGQIFDERLAHYRSEQDPADTLHRCLVDDLSLDPTGPRFVFFTARNRLIDMQRHAEMWLGRLLIGASRPPGAAPSLAKWHDAQLVSDLVRDVMQGLDKIQPAEILGGQPPPRRKVGF
jgi:hypothetical protein